MKKTLGTALAVAIMGIFVLPQIASAATYYVDATLGSDSANGTSTSTPWQTITRVNSLTPAAGDQILFKRGETFAGSVSVFNKNGASGNPVIFGAYGTGANPVINAAGNTYAFYFSGSSSYITVQDLTIRGGSAQQVYIFTGSFNSLAFKDLDIASTTAFTMHANATTTNSLFRNLNIHDTTGAAFDYDNKAINDTFEGITSTGTFRIDQSSAATSTIHMSDSHFTGATIYARKLVNSSFEDLTLTNSGIIVDIGLENTTFTDISQTGSSGHGFDFDSGYFENVTITNATTTNNALDGINFGTISGSNGLVTITDLNSSDNTGEGLDWTGRGTNPRLSVTNATFEGNGTSGTLSNGLSISGLGYATTTNATARANSNDGFNVKGSVHAIFDHTTSIENGTDGQEISGSGDGYSWHNTSTGVLKDSFVQDNQKGGVTNIDTSSVTVYNTIFVQDAVVPTGSNVNFANSSVGNLYNNTVYGSALGKGIRYENTSSGTLYNNIVQGFDEGIIDGTSGILAEDYNLSFGAASSTYSGFARGAHSLSADPRFVNAGTDNFRLLQSSPAINAGTTTAYATDYLGNARVGATDMGAYEYQGIPDLTAPSVSITAPADGVTVSGDVTVSATASDGVGVEAVQFFLDGAELDDDTSSPYAITWDTTGAIDGGHTLFAVAHDAAGNYATSSSVTVTVSNADEDSGSRPAGRSGQRSSAPSPQADSVVNGSGSGSPTALTNLILANRALFVSAQQQGIMLPAFVLQILGSGAASSSFSRDLTTGSAGDDVRALQLWLIAKGYQIPAGATGYFGEQTRAAVSAYQAATGIAPSMGYFGPKTRASIGI